jgi:hypothetical protein
MNQQKNLNENEKLNPKISNENKQPKHYTPESEKITPKQNEGKAGPRRSRGKKQRRQFKLAPNRG